MEALRLSITTIIARKTVFIWIALLLVGSLVFPLLIPWEEKPSLLEPARAQTAWSLAWLFILGWGLYQAATFGDQWASKGLLEYFRSMGVSRFGRLLQLWAGCLAFCLAFLAIALLVSLATAMPHSRSEAGMWILTNLQYAWLFALAMSPLVMLAIALGTRLNATAAYCITAGLAIYGLFAIAYLDFFLSQSGNPFFDLVFLLSPHYHLADLTDRLVFKMGALDAATFVQTTLYLAGLGSVTTAASCLLYRECK